MFFQTSYNKPAYRQPGKVSIENSRSPYIQPAQ